VKDDRRRAIMELVRSRPVHTQSELAEALAGLGFPTTQATISRDIQEMGLVRTGSGYRVGPPPALLAPELVLSVRQVEFLLVVRTPPGTANFVARAIDESDLEGVAGTVAGDDTLLVVLEDRDAAEPVRRFLNV
jgi:transcriptional regulator of arginine metabolism